MSASWGSSQLEQAWLLYHSRCHMITEIVKSYECIWYTQHEQAGLQAEMLLVPVAPTLAYTLVLHSGFVV